MSLSDFLIALCAGRGARQRMERKRTEEYFKTLSDPPDDHPWAAQFRVCEVGTITGQRSLKKPWEEPNSGITFRYRYDAQNQTSTSPAIKRRLYELLIPGESSTHPPNRLRISSSTILPTWSPQHTCSFPEAALPLPMLKIHEDPHPYAGAGKEGDQFPGCMFPSLQTDSVDHRIQEHRHQYEPARFKIASDRWHELVETVGRHGNLDIASRRTIPIAKANEDRGFEIFYHKRAKKISSTSDVYPLCHGNLGLTGLIPEEDCKTTILVQDMICSNPGHASCTNDLPDEARNNKKSPLSLLTKNRNGGIQQLSCLDPVSLVQGLRTTYILAHQWNSQDTVVTHNLLKLEAHEREMRDRRALRNREGRARYPARPSPSQPTRRRGRRLAKDDIAIAPTKALIERRPPVLARFEVLSEETGCDVKICGLRDDVWPTAGVRSTTVDRTLRNKAKHWPSYLYSASVANLQEADLVAKKGDGDHRGTEYFNDHLLQTKAQRDLARYLPHLFPPRPSIKIRVKPGSQVSFAAVLRRNVQKCRIELSGLKLLFTGQSESLVGGSESSECAVIDTDSDAESEGERSIVEEEDEVEEGEGQILSASTMIVLQHVMEEEQEERKRKQIVAASQLTSLAEKFETSDEEWDPVCLVEVARNER